MTSSTPSPIFLLKTKSTPTDNYQEYFSRTGNFEPHFVPVLEHIYHHENLRVIRDLFLSGSLDGGSSDGKGKKYGGLIFTSQRAVEGFARLLEEEVPCTYIHTHALHLPLTRYENNYVYIC
jgi:uroporphyrinogen-III synthase